MPEMSMDEAAARLGVSRSTIRRRIGRGELPGQKESTDHGDIWVVTLPDEGGDTMADTTTNHGDQNHPEVDENHPEVDTTPELEDVHHQAPAGFTPSKPAYFVDQAEVLPEATAEYGGEEPEASSNQPEALIAEEEMPCAICKKPIDEGDEYVTASYGSVHLEPCSHQSFQG